MTTREQAGLTCWASLAIVLFSLIWVLLVPSWPPIILMGFGTALYIVTLFVHTYLSMDDI